MSNTDRADQATETRVMESLLAAFRLSNTVTSTVTQPHRPQDDRPYPAVTVTAFDTPFVVRIGVTAHEAALGTGEPIVLALVSVSVEGAESPSAFTTRRFLGALSSVNGAMMLPSLLAIFRSKAYPRAPASFHGDVLYLRDHRMTHDVPLSNAHLVHARCDARFDYSPGRRGAAAGIFCPRCSKDLPVPSGTDTVARLFGWLYNTFGCPDAPGMHRRHGSP